MFLSSVRSDCMFSPLPEVQGSFYLTDCQELCLNIYKLITAKKISLRGHLQDPF